MSGLRKRSISDDGSYVRSKNSREKFARLIVCKFMERYPYMRSEEDESSRHRLRRSNSSPAVLGEGEEGGRRSETEEDLVERGDRPFHLAETLHLFWAQGAEDLPQQPPPTDIVELARGGAGAGMARHEPLGYEPAAPGLLDEETMERITSRLTRIAVQLENDPQGTRLSGLTATSISQLPELSYGAFASFLDNIVASNAFPQQFHEPYHRVAFVLFVSFLCLTINETLNARVFAVLDIAARYTATFVVPKFPQRRASEVFSAIFRSQTDSFSSPNDDLQESPISDSVFGSPGSSVDVPDLESLSINDEDSGVHFEASPQIDNEFNFEATGARPKKTTKDQKSPSKKSPKPYSEDSQTTSGVSAADTPKESWEGARSQARESRRSRGRALSEQVIETLANSDLSSDPAVGTMLTLALCAAYFNYRNS